MSKLTPTKSKIVPSSVIASYNVTSARRLQYENLMWQVPALSMSAQALLISVTIDPETSPHAKLITSALSVMIGLVSIQLLQKHRYHEVLECKQLEVIEKKYDMLGLHAPVEERAEHLKHSRGRIDSLSAFKVWRLTLLVFALTGLVMTVDALIALINQTN